MITLVRMSSFPNQVIVLEGKVVTTLLKTKIAISKVIFLEVCQLCNFEFHNHKSLIRNQELPFERFRMKDPSSESNMVSKYETEVKMLKIAFRKSERNFVSHRLILREIILSLIDLKQL